MCKYERLARLMWLMQLIRISRRPNRIFLAERLGVCQRTIQRDINSLSYAGVPIFWADGRYQIMDGYFMPPTNLSLTEVHHLVSAAREYLNRQTEPERKTIESALLKIIASLPDEIRREMEVDLSIADR